MTNFLKILFDFVIWFFVPATLVVVIWFARSTSTRFADTRHRSAAQAGFWAGVMLFVMFLIYEVGLFIQTGFPDRDIYQGFNFWLAITGGIAGFLLFSGGKKVIPPKLSGIIVLAVTFLSFAALLHYLFIRSYNEVFLSLILGVMFGVLTHFAASPSSLKDFLES